MGMEVVLRQVTIFRHSGTVLQQSVLVVFNRTKVLFIKELSILSGRGLCCNLLYSVGPYENFLFWLIPLHCMYVEICILIYSTVFHEAEGSVPWVWSLNCGTSSPNLPLNTCNTETWDHKCSLKCTKCLNNKHPIVSNTYKLLEHFVVLCLDDQVFWNHG